MSILWDIAPCCLIDTDISKMHSTFIMRAIALMMEPVRTSETSVYFNETALRYSLSHQALTFMLALSRIKNLALFLTAAHRTL
jgi:hypothetical protein